MLKWKEMVYKKSLKLSLCCFKLKDVHNRKPSEIMLVQKIQNQKKNKVTLRNNIRESNKASVNIKA